MRPCTTIHGIPFLTVLPAPILADTLATNNRITSPDPLHTTLALLLIVLLIVIFLLLLRRFGSFPPIKTRSLHIVAALPLGQRERVIVVQTGRKQLVLGICPGRIDTLCILEGEDQIITETSTDKYPSPDFIHTLRQIIRQQAT